MQFLITGGLFRASLSCWVPLALPMGSFGIDGCAVQLFWGYATCNQGRRGQCVYENDGFGGVGVPGNNRCLDVLLSSVVSFLRLFLHCVDADFVGGASKVMLYSCCLPPVWECAAAVWLRLQGCQYGVNDTYPDCSDCSGPQVSCCVSSKFRLLSIPSHFRIPVLRPQGGVPQGTPVATAPASCYIPPIRSSSRKAAWLSAVTRCCHRLCG